MTTRINKFGKLAEMKFVLLLMFIAISWTTKAKPRFIQIDSVLNHSQSMEFGKIVEYSDSTLIYQVEYIKTVNNQVVVTKEKRKAKLRFYSNSFIGLLTAGGLPEINDSCLLVIDTLGFVTLFGKEIKEHIVFWSPLYTGSECLIKHSELFATYEKGNEVDGDSDLLLSWGSVKISLDDFYAFFQLRIIECGRILFQDKKALFIPDFAYSRAYTITNWIDFDLEDESTYCIQGDLRKSSLTIIRRIE